MGTFGDIRNNFQIALDKVQRLNELDFKDKSEFDEYKSKHDMRDTTEVTIDGKSMKVGDVGKNTNIKNKLEKKIKGIQGEYKRIAFDNEEDAKVFPETFDKLLGGEKLTDEESKMVAKYAKIATTDKGDTLKIYFASNSPGNFLQGGREKALQMSDKDGSLQKDMIENGMETTPSMTSGTIPAKIGTKQINPNKLTGGKTRKVKVKKEVDKDGNIQSIVVDGKKMSRMSPPDPIKLEKALAKQNPDLTEDQIKSLAKRTNRAIERNNEQLSRMANMEDLEVLEPVSGLEGLSQKEAADKITKEYSNKIADEVEKMLGENPTKAELAVVDKMKALADIEDAAEYEAACIDALSAMDGVDSMRKGSSDLLESYAYIWMNKKGIKTVLPAGETFPVSDIITMGGDIDLNDLDPSDPEYADKIAMQGLPFVVNLESSGGVSVKKDGGAASAAKNKIDESVFKNEKTNEKLHILTDNHNSFLGTKKEPTTPETIEKGQKLMNDTQKWAQDSGILPKDYKPMYGSRTPKQWAEDTLKMWEEDGRGPFADHQLKALEMHAHQAILLADMHNAELTEQKYGNINGSTKKKDAGFNVTDGINDASLMSPSLNPGFKFIKGEDGNMIPRPNAIYSANLEHGEWDPQQERFVSTKKKNNM
jgi:hypothetical protein